MPKVTVGSKAGGGIQTSVCLVAEPTCRPRTAMAAARAGPRGESSAQPGQLPRTPWGLGGVKAGKAVERTGAQEPGEWGRPQEEGPHRGGPQPCPAQTSTSPYSCMVPWPPQHGSVTLTDIQTPGRTLFCHSPLPHSEPGVPVLRENPHTRNGPRSPPGHWY